MEVVDVTSEARSRGKEPVSAALAGPYGHPFHPILVTAPIGAWVAGLVFDIASRVAHDPGFLTRGSMWLIALGVLGALLAAMAGFLDLFAIPPGTPAFRTALLHMSLNLLVTALYAGGFAWRHAAGPAGGGGRTRRAAPSRAGHRRARAGRRGHGGARPDQRARRRR
jgi:hypothetical protein